jgi:hypothetical protein
MAEITNTIWQDNAIIGMDGSSANSHSAYAFVILIHLNRDEPTVAIKSGGNLPDLAEHIDMDSHQLEAAGLYSGLCWVQWLLQCFMQPPSTGMPPKIPFVLDKKSMAEADMEWDFNSTTTSVFDYLKSDYDILQGILSVMDELPLQAQVCWVKGHQDHYKPRNELPIKALTNCHPDDECTATHFATQTLLDASPNWVPGTKAALLHNGKLVTKKTDEYVTIAATASQLCTYMIECSKKHDHLSHMNHWTPTNNHLAIIDNKNNQLCFACQHLCEDIDHVQCCPSK